MYFFSRRDIFNEILTIIQVAITCSKLTIETLEEGGTYVQSY